MFSCWRGVLLPIAAGFKKIPEDIQIKQVIDAKNFSKTMEKQLKSNPKNDAGNYRNIIKNIANLVILGPILEPVA